MKKHMFDVVFGAMAGYSAGRLVTTLTGANRTFGLAKMSDAALTITAAFVVQGTAEKIAGNLRRKACDILGVIEDYKNDCGWDNPDNDIFTDKEKV